MKETIILSLSKETKREREREREREVIPSCGAK